MTAQVDTTGGRVRGRVADGVRRFLGIPYGADTRATRFQPATPPPSWAGIRECLMPGPQAPQGPVSLPGVTDRQDGPCMPVALGIQRDYAGNVPESEDCLYLNVFTPDADASSGRPVMVWLHGGAFAVGAGFNAMTDGGLLAVRGDIVVVSLNHRLNALGYLYLGALHEDFADSGNSGHFDIVLALEWVRDNIAAFGGDPGNVTVFGESGGGAKTGALLGMLPARGLFHKAIVQSGPAATLVDRDDAAEIAERTLAALNLRRADVHKLQAMDWAIVIEAASRVRLSTGHPGLTQRTLAPCVDGRSIPAHPFHPIATEISRSVPLMIGTTKDEWTQMLGMSGRFGVMDAAEAATYFQAYAGDKADAAFEFYRAARPDDSPTYWVSSFLTDLVMWVDSIATAERKAAQDGAAVFMYRLDYEPKVLGGILRATHSIDVPLVLGTLLPPELIGTGREVERLSETMMRAWIDFARHGSPASQDLAWPPYCRDQRSTMIFDTSNYVRQDPDQRSRLFWDVG